MKKGIWVRCQAHNLLPDGSCDLHRIHKVDPDFAVLFGWAEEWVLKLFYKPHDKKVG